MQLYDLPPNSEKTWANRRVVRRGSMSNFVLWHLLSLDAPTVAVVWMTFTAAVTHTVLPIVNSFAMGLAVWVLYAIDRLLDSRHLAFGGTTGGMPDMELRHEFHAGHRPRFLAGTGVACGLLLLLVPWMSTEDVQLYLVEAGFFCFYFAAIHLPEHLRFGSSPFLQMISGRVSKELMVGPFFAFAVFIPVLTRNPAMRSSLLPMCLLFAALCSLNCLSIHAWEHPVPGEGHGITLYSIRHLGGLTRVFVFLCAGCSVLLGMTRPCSLMLYPVACAGSALLLWTINRFRSRLSPVVLRTAADAALLTPLVLLPFVCRWR